MFKYLFITLVPYMKKTRVRLEKKWICLILNVVEKSNTGHMWAKKKKKKIRFDLLLPAA